MKKRPTIIDVAKAAGVTDGTVSRALRGDSRVRADTRERVLKAAQNLGYVPNLSARHFKHGRTNNIGILCDSGAWMIYNPYFGRLIAGLADAAAANGYRVVFYLPEEGPKPPVGNPDAESVRLRGTSELQDGRVDAAVVVGGRRSVRDDLEALRNIHLPVVLMSNNAPETGFFQVLSGARERAYQATQALLTRAGGPPALLGLYEGSTYNVESESGWRDALLQAKLTPPKDFVLDFKHWNIADPKDLLEMTSKVAAAGAKSMVCSDSLQAERLMQLQRDGALKLPEGFLFATFSPRPDMNAPVPKNLLLLETDLEAAGHKTFELVKKALDGQAPLTYHLEWKLSGPSN